MDPVTASLTRLARAQLTAVNQQFSHMLILHQWGRHSVAEAIKRADDADFASSMAVLEHLVERGRDFEISGEPVAIGRDEAHIIEIEMASEARLSGAIEDARGHGEETRRFVEAAEAPRAAYLNWLRAHRPDAPRAQVAPDDVSNSLNALHCRAIGLLEQALVHAYVHRAQGDLEAANAAWSTSGAAMMVATRVTAFLGGRGQVPESREIPPIDMSLDPATAPERDQAAIAALAGPARSLTDDGLSGFQAFIDAMVAWVPGMRPPVTDLVPQSFHDFEAALARHQGV